MVLGYDLIFLMLPDFLALIEVLPPTWLQWRFCEWNMYTWVGWCLLQSVGLFHMLKNTDVFKTYVRTDI